MNNPAQDEGFNWLDEYKIGDSLIDQQHEHLFELANRIISPYNDQQTTYLNSMALYDYVGKHFAAEESLMQKYDYPEYEAHKELHKSLAKKLDSISEGILNDETTKEDVTKFMKKWVLVHILNEDMRFGSFLKSAKNT